MAHICTLAWKQAEAAYMAAFRGESQACRITLLQDKEYGAIILVVL